MNVSALTKTILFRGITPEEADQLLRCLQAERRVVPKGQQIYRMGDLISTMGIVLRGSVLIESSDLWGNVAALDRVRPGGVFGEVYAFAAKPLMVNVVTAEETEALFFSVGHALDVCANTCGCHVKLMKNLLAICAQKNLNLSRKIFYTTPKSIRRRVLSYLSDQMLEKGTQSFDIPFSRQQLADYLNVERTALSKELGKMQRDGLLRFERSRFTLLEAKIE